MRETAMSAKSGGKAREGHVYRTALPRDESGRILGEGEAPHDPLLQASRTAQLLFMGSTIAIAGLLFSFIMVGFRANCDSERRMGTWMRMTESNDSDWKLCKTLRPGRSTSALEDHHQYGTVSEIAWSPCKTNDDCKEFETGFCSVGKNKVNTPGSCEKADSECTCHSVIWDCGLEQSFKLRIKISDFVTGCNHSSVPEPGAPKYSEYCNHSTALRIPKWTKHRTEYIGCEWFHKTDLEEGMQRVQEKIRRHGMTNTLKLEDDPVWEDLEEALRHTVDIYFDWFWPSTISESVASAMSPEQKIFVGFMLCAGLSLFRSDYTTECRTVDLPHRMVPCIHLEVNTLRAWLPPIGLIMLAMVEMVPTSEIYDMPHGLMTMVHLLGAQFCFVVYLAAELIALMDGENKKKMTHRTEWASRALLCGIGICSMGVFAVSYGILAVFSGKGTCPYTPSFLHGYSDMYERNSIDKVSHLVRPASGGFRILKMVSYFAELNVALSILVSKLVIWWHFTIRIHDGAKKAADRWALAADRGALMME